MLLAEQIFPFNVLQITFSAVECIRNHLLFLVNKLLKIVTAGIPFPDRRIEYGGLKSALQSFFGPEIATFCLGEVDKVSSTS